MISAIVTVAILSGVVGAWTGLLGTTIYLATRRFVGSKKLLRRNVWVIGPIPSQWISELDDMLDKLEELWVDRVGTRGDFRRAMDGLTLEYFKGNSLVVIDQGSPRKFSGIFISKKYAKIAIKKGGLGNTATAHEIGHIVLAHTPPHYEADPDHEGDRWPGWKPEVTAVTEEVNISFQMILPANDDEKVPLCGSCK